MPTQPHAKQGKIMQVRSLIPTLAALILAGAAAHADTISGTASFGYSNLVCSSPSCSITQNSIDSPFNLYKVTDGIPYTDSNFLKITETGTGSADLSLDFTITDPGTGSGTEGGTTTFELRGRSNTPQGTITWDPVTIALAESGGMFQDLTIALNSVTNGNLSNGSTFDAKFTLDAPESVGVVPEPSSLLLLSTGLLGGAFALRRKLSCTRQSAHMA
jgi:hypothetical protein